MAFIARHQPAEVLQLGEEALDLPAAAVAPQLSADLEVVSRLPERDQHARRGEKGAVMFELVVIARDETPEVVQPRVGAFNDPAAAVAAESAAILIPMFPILAMRDDQVNATAFETVPELSAVVPAIGDDALRLRPGPARAGARHRYVGERRFREPYDPKPKHREPSRI